MTERMQVMNHAGEWIDIMPMVEHSSLTEVLGVMVSERAWELEHLTGGMSGEPRGVLGQLDRSPVPAASDMSLLPDWATQRRPA